MEHRAAEWDELVAAGLVDHDGNVTGRIGSVVTARPRPLVEVEVAEPERMPISAYEQAPDVGFLNGPTSWRPRDLTSVLVGEDVAPPEYLRRMDGVALIYRGAVNWLQGPPESMKSMLVQFGVVETIRAGGRVLYVDFEDNERTLMARLVALGMAPETVATAVTYLRPDEALMVKDRPTPALTDFARVLDAGPYELAVIDGVTEAMTVEGLSLLENADVATWMRRLPKRLADRGCAVVCIDHVVKNSAERGRYALGAQHKLAAVTGAAYTLRVLRPLARATGTTETAGAVMVDVVKDRPGHVRASAVGSTIAVLNASSWPDGGLSLTLDPPGAETVGPDMSMVLEILEHLDAYPGATGANVVASVKAREQDVRSALKWMADGSRAWVRIEPNGRSQLHHLTAAGRQELGQ